MALSGHTVCSEKVTQGISSYTTVYLNWNVISHFIAMTALLKSFYLQRTWMISAYKQCSIKTGTSNDLVELEPAPLTQWGRDKWTSFRRRHFKCIILNENIWIRIEISLKFASKGPMNNIPAMVQIMAWRRPGDKPLSEPMVISLPTHICVARPQWVK